MVRLLNAYRWRGNAAHRDGLLGMAFGSLLLHIGNLFWKRCGSTVTPLLKEVVFFFGVLIEHGLEGKEWGADCIITVVVYTTMFCGRLG